MNKLLYNISLFFAAAIVSFLAFSCTDVKESIDPVFPEIVVENDIVPGTELTLTFTPNMDWKVSVPEESYKWFKIMDGKFEVPSISEKSSGAPVTVTIATTDEQSIMLRSCAVTLTMGGQTQVIAEYRLHAEAKALEVRAASMTESGFEYSDGSYVFSDHDLAPDDTIKLIWDDNLHRFYAPILVSSNYEWEVEWPEWARTDFSASSRADDLQLEVYGIPSRLPENETFGEIIFKDADQVVKKCNVVIPGCAEMFQYNLSGYTSLAFDHACYFHSSSGSYTKDAVRGSVYGPRASRVVILENIQGRYYVPSGDSWVDVTVEEWDTLEGADVLQNREISITVQRYSAAQDRQAMILFLPATAPGVTSMLTADRTQLREEYAEYAVYLSQSGRPEEYFTFEESSAAIAEAGIIYEKAAEAILPEKNFTFVSGCEDWQYDLSYVKEYASSKSALYITESYSEVEVYDAEGNHITEDLSEYWLSYNPLGDGLYGQILMDNTKMEKKDTAAIDGYIVFKDEDDAVLCAVHCFYKAEVKTEEDVLEDVADMMFVDPSAAAAAGATIHKVISGPTYEAYKEHNAPIYIVKYTKNKTTLEIKTSDICTIYSCMGKPNGPEMVTIDSQIFYDKEFYDKFEVELEKYNELLNQYKEGLIPDPPTYPDTSTERSTMGWLTFGKTCFITRTYPGSSTFNMTRPSGSQAKVMEEVIQFTDSKSILFVFVCVLDLN